MIARLVGRLISEEVTGSLVLDVSGVGYELHCPVGTLGRAEKATGSDDCERFVLQVHTNVRQDCIELFGFCSQEERATFRQLVNVPGVGPRLAISVLNVLPSKALAQVVEAEDRARLIKVPGVGKKTAERLVLELRGKLALDAPSKANSRLPREGNESTLSLRLIAALTGLGYRTSEAERAAKALLVKERNSKDLSLLLREALDLLAP